MENLREIKALEIIKAHIIELGYSANDLEKYLLEVEYLDFDKLIPDPQLEIREICLYFENFKYEVDVSDYTTYADAPDEYSLDSVGSITGTVVITDKDGDELETIEINSIIRNHLN